MEHAHYDMDQRLSLRKSFAQQKNYDPITIEYADPSLKNLRSEFDINWILCDDDSLLYSSDGCYNVAAGDATTIFAVCGFMGNPSKYLITSINRPNILQFLQKNGLQREYVIQNGSNCN